MTRDRALIIGVVGLIGCAIGVLLAPRDALVAWLVAWLALGLDPDRLARRSDAGRADPGQLARAVRAPAERSAPP